MNEESETNETEIKHEESETNETEIKHQDECNRTAKCLFDSIITHDENVVLNLSELLNEHLSE